MRRFMLLSLVFMLVAATWTAMAASGGAGPALARAVYTAQAMPRLGQAMPRRLVVFKRYGAALHVSASSSAPIRQTLPCGTVMRVVSSAGGWDQVLADRSAVGSPHLQGWVGGARVADAANPPAYDCTGAYTFQVSARAYSFVKTGCLSLRVAPSPSASYHYCVRNVHDYTVTGGPITVAGEDWFAVYSVSTGGGWALARYLLPYYPNRYGPTGRIPACDPAALFAAAVRKEGFDPRSPGYAGFTGDSAARATYQLCSGAWALATIGRPLVGDTDGDTLFTVASGQWSEVEVLGYPVSTCRLEGLGVPAATAKSFVRHLGGGPAC